MGDDASACEGHAGESCGWTIADEGQGYHCQPTSWGTGCEPGGQTCPSGGASNPGKPPSGSCNASAWVYMGDNASACEGHAGESCGWTSVDEGQGYHCQATSWGTGCEPGGQTCGGGGSSGSGGASNPTNPTTPSGEFSREAQYGLLTDQQGTQVALQVAWMLMRDFGLSTLQAAGVVGNLHHESGGMNANMNQQYAYNGPGGPGAPSGDLNQGYGWAQWTYGRKGLFLGYCSQQGLNPASPAANYAYLKHELETDQAATISALRAAVSPEDAARIFRRVFEVAEIPNDDGRIFQANRLFGLL
jgi:hypothetical protein